MLALLAAFVVVGSLSRSCAAVPLAYDDMHKMSELDVLDLLDLDDDGFDVVEFDEFLTNELVKRNILMTGDWTLPENVTECVMAPGCQQDSTDSQYGPCKNKEGTYEETCCGCFCYRGFCRATAPDMTVNFPPPPPPPPMMTGDGGDTSTETTEAETDTMMDGTDAEDSGTDGGTDDSTTGDGSSTMGTDSTSSTSVIFMSVAALVAAAFAATA